MRAALIALAAGSLWASAASSQPRIPPTAVTETQPATTLSGVVVEAPTKDALKKFDDAATQFVKDNGQPGMVRQLSRWTRSVCPETFGLQKDLNAYISQRIRTLAKDVGATGPVKCTGDNVLIVFTIHPDAVMADVRDHHTILLGPHYINETRQLAAFQPPMKSWYVTVTGVPVYVSSNKSAPELRTFDDAYGKEQPDCTGIRECTLEKMRTMKSEFVFALIVVDSGRIVGQPIGAIADKVAMEVLTRPGQRNGCSALPSVVDVLDPACPSSRSTRGLTAYDKAYLKALYAPHDTEILYYERERISRAIQAVGLSPPSDEDPVPVAAADTKPQDTPAPPGPGRPADQPGGAEPAGLTGSAPPTSAAAGG